MSANAAKLSSELTLIDASTSDPNRSNAIVNSNSNAHVSWEMKIQRPGNYKVLVNFKATKSTNVGIQLSVDDSAISYTFKENESADFKEKEIGTIQITPKSLAASSLKVLLKVIDSKEGLPEIANIKLVPID